MKLSSKIKTFIWVLKLAYSINGKFFIIGSLVSIMLSMMPSIIVVVQKKIYYGIEYLNGKEKWELLIQIIVLGIVLSLSNFGKNMYSSYIKELVYDYYNVGMENLVINSMNRIQIETFFEQTFADKFRYLKYKYTALPNYIATFWILGMDLISCLLFMLIMAKQSVLLSGIMVIYSICAIFIINLLNDKVKFDYISYRECEAEVNYIEESAIDLGTAKEIRINNIDDRIKEIWIEAYAPIEAMEKRIGKWRAYIGVINSFCYFGVFALIVLYMFNSIAKADVNTGDFLAILLMIQGLASNIWNFLTNYEISVRNLQDLKEIKEILEEITSRERNKPMLICENKEGEEKVENAVIFMMKNVNFSYIGKKYVLKNISLEIKENRITAILGLNGSGKSTLLKILLGIYKEYEGKIYFCGKDFRESNAHCCVKKMNSFLQNGTLFHATIGENIKFGEIEQIDNDEKMFVAAEKGKVKNIKYIKDRWLFREVDSNGLMLSGGQMERVLLARTYMGDKKILIYDEPGVALDPVSEFNIYKDIFAKKEKKTIILVSHKVGYVQFADDIIFLNNGEVIAKGTHKELMKGNAKYRTMYYEQAKWYEQEKNKNEIFI